MLCEKHPHFHEYVRKIDFDWQPDSPFLAGEFLYPLFGAGGPNIDALVQYIYRSLVPFCLPRGEVKRVLDAAWAAHDANAIITLGDRARELFVRTRGAALNGGEAGELLLFLILEAVVKAPLLISKMSLKTNSNMNVHGRDGIHVRYCPDLKGLVLHLGEAKLHTGLATAVDDAIGSIVDYLSDLSLRTREIDIINGNMDLTGLAPEVQGYLQDTLNPYISPPPVFHTVHTCFIGFNYHVYSKVAKLSGDAIESTFQQIYAKRAGEIAALIQKKVGNTLPEPNRLRFFVMPFPDLTVFRKAFAQKLGVHIA
ncbi:hypothetical protein HK26_08180 [Acetobacter okinawensis]|uniref:Anti-bacteriophage protein A/HamA C-terminal domain-containing protein n=2 Tax=Acetobacter okinawensis TaxID=1076594 RepID=A0A252BS41_9PROT|nr:hypothetical protein HK26_08180 [Acetobacter okinawensis]